MSSAMPVACVPGCCSYCGNALPAGRQAGRQVLGMHACRHRLTSWPQHCARPAAWAALLGSATGKGPVSGVVADGATRCSASWCNDTGSTVLRLRAQSLS